MTQKIRGNSNTPIQSDKTVKRGTEDPLILSCTDSYRNRIDDLRRKMVRMGDLSNYALKRYSQSQELYLFGGNSF